MAHSFEHELKDLLVPHEGSLPDLSGHSGQPAGVLQPKNRNDVLRIVRTANRFRTRLHAVSCGRNWGFGSSLPAKDGVWIVNLSCLNRISGYDPELGTISVEPGVTQIQLHHVLEKHGGTWFFNVTGAGHSTSVLGNALERGIGYFGQRNLDLSQLEVITGDGNVTPSRLVPTDSAALGIDLTSLFAQSALGIVVSAQIRLIKRTDGGGAVVVRLADPNRFTDLLGDIIALKQDGAIGGVPHIANRERIITTMLPWLEKTERNQFASKCAAWTAALPITGSKELTQTAFQMIERRLGGFCHVQTLLAASGSIKEESDTHPSIQLQQLASGYPSNLALPGVEWSALGEAKTDRNDPESSEAGLIHITPAVPATLKTVTKALSVIYRRSRELDLDSLPITLNLMDRTAVLVISLSFPRSKAKAFRLKARNLESFLKRARIFPYRIGLGQEHWQPKPSQISRSLFLRVKRTFDPSSVFQHSKYEERLLKD